MPSDEYMMKAAGGMLQAAEAMQQTQTWLAETNERQLGNLRELVERFEQAVESLVRIGMKSNDK